jgi:hypothetical protein
LVGAPQRRNGDFDVYSFGEAEWSVIADEVNG